MRRVVSLYLPTWPTDRIRRRNGAPPPDEPLVTVKTEGSRRLIGAVDRAAHALGLRPGQTIAHAQALVPNLHVVEATPEEDEAALVAAGALVHRLFAHRRRRIRPMASGSTSPARRISSAARKSSSPISSAVSSRRASRPLPAWPMHRARPGPWCGTERRVIVPPGRSVEAVARPAGSGSAPAAGDGRGASSSRHRADRPARRHAARADGPPLRQGGRAPARSGLRPCLRAAQPAGAEGGPGPARYLRRADRAAGGSESVVQRLAGPPLPGSCAGGSRRAPPRSDLRAHRPPQRRFARRDRKGDTGGEPSRQALRRAPADGRSRASASRPAVLVASKVEPLSERRWTAKDLAEDECSGCGSEPPGRSAWRTAWAEAGLSPAAGRKPHARAVDETRSGSRAHDRSQSGPRSCRGRRAFSIRPSP